MGIVDWYMYEIPDSMFFTAKSALRFIYLRFKNSERNFKRSTRIIVLAFVRIFVLREIVAF
jgi:hypothetical protein